MPGITAKSTKIGLIFVTATFVGTILTCDVSAQSAGGTTISTTICGTGSSVTISSPVSDSVVTDSVVTLSGTVTQASQIEVYVDNLLNNIIPLGIGQATYDSQVQLAAGTHTIKVVAINTCPGPNELASSVVTYVPSSQASPSNGAKTPTEIGGGVNLSEGKGRAVTNSTSKIVPDFIATPFQQSMSWLNISTSDHDDAGSGLSAWRAATITVGLGILIVGVAGVVVQATMALSPIANLLGSASPAIRQRIVGGTYRVIGLLIVVLALVL